MVISADSRWRIQSEVPGNYGACSANGKAITITKRGKPIAKLVPLDPSTPRAPLFGRMAGSAAYEGDLLAPVEVDWQVLTAQVGIAPSEGARQKANRVAMPRRKKR